MLQEVTFVPPSISEPLLELAPAVTPATGLFLEPTTHVTPGKKNVTPGTGLFLEAATPVPPPASEPLLEPATPVTPANGLFLEPATPIPLPTSEPLLEPVMPVTPATGLFLEPATPVPLPTAEPLLQPATPKPTPTTGPLLEPVTPAQTPTALFWECHPSLNLFLLKVFCKESKQLGIISSKRDASTNQELWFIDLTCKKEN